MEPSQTEPLQDYLRKREPIFEAFLTEKWKRYDDDDLYFFFKVKDIQREERSQDEENLVKPVWKYEAEANSIILKNKKLEECLTQNGTLYELGDSPGGWILVLLQHGMRGVGFSKASNSRLMRATNMNITILISVLRTH